MRQALITFAIFGMLAACAPTETEMATVSETETPTRETQAREREQAAADRRAAIEDRIAGLAARGIREIS